MVTLYLFALLPDFSGIDHDHHSHSSHDHDSHYELCEDACYNSVYHGIQSKDCNHESHFSTKEDLCLSCQHLVKSQYSILQKVSHSFEINFCISSVIFSTEPSYSNIAYAYLQRGPPSVIV